MGKSRVAAHRKTDAKLKSKRGDASKEVVKDPNKLKRPASALFVVIYVSFFLIFTVSFVHCRLTMFY
ncbi:hypothetical protein EV1_039880 [Malus domestica]